jgi:hypothetical protein
MDKSVPEKHIASISCPEAGRNMFLRNVGNSLAHYMMS